MNAPVLEEVLAGRAPGVLSLTVDQYHRMIELGILREGEATELIDGILVRKDRSDTGGNPMAHGPRHSLVLKRLLRQLQPVASHGYHLHPQLPVTLADMQEPEPDLAVVRGQAEDFLDRHPRSSDLLASIEVSDTTLDYDRTTKQRLYAQAGIVLYWIVNIPEGQIEVYERPIPAEGRYAVRKDFGRGQLVRLEIGNAAIEVPVDQVIPR